MPPLPAPEYPQQPQAQPVYPPNTPQNPNQYQQPQNYVPQDPYQAGYGAQPQQYYAEPDPAQYQQYDQYQQYQQYPQPKRSKKPLFVAVFVAVGLGVAGLLFALTNTQPNPEIVFANAVENSLSTKHVKQVTSLEGSGEQTYQYDTSEPDDPKVYSAVDASIIGVDFKLRQYATLKDSFVSYEQYGPLFESDTPLQDYKGKWMQTRRDGRPVSTSPNAADVFFPDAYVSLFGDWIFGNFSDADRRVLMRLIVDREVYKYDPEKVEQKQLDGRDVYVYSVTYDKDKRKAMNEKVAEIWKADFKEIEEVLESSALDSGPETAKLYIDMETEQLVQVEADAFDDPVVTTKYSEYDKATIPKRPDSEKDYAAFISATEALDELRMF